MKKRKRVIYSVIIGSVLLGIVGFCLSSIYPSYHRRIQQEQFANDLGVVIDDYPPSYNFPYGYFVSLLNDQMDIVDVHELIVGYEQVLSCGRNREVYYYFSSTDDNNAVRFEITYDENYYFSSAFVGDENSFPISTTGCIQGLVQP